MPGAMHEPSKRIIVPGRDRVELVVMAPSAADTQSQEGLGQDVDLVVDPPHLLFEDIHGRMRPLAEEVEAGSQDRLIEPVRRVSPRRLEKVARDLFHYELVV